MITNTLVPSTVEYVCNDNYRINDKSKMVISCALGAIWNYTTLPECLKGLFRRLYNTVSLLRFKKIHFKTLSVFEQKLNFIIFIVCDAVPDVENSKYSYTIPITREGDYVTGTTVEYNCDVNYIQVIDYITCGDDGSWSNEVECYPGK